MTDQISDIELAGELAHHIINPCKEGMQESYSIRARLMMRTMENPYAISFLEAVIRKYSSSS
ncbi:MAG: hypothetical protein CMH64_02795 [Nanoarchaeota archaeon]|nr:hypothetical protein [Nanoarchaeota archaeon]|tara:strand:+ start:701 stop:886 length:186 start_codon:yes stop_codon:yes gene_type:complete